MIRIKLICTTMAESDNEQQRLALKMISMMATDMNMVTNSNTVNVYNDDDHRTGTAMYRIDARIIALSAEHCTIAM